MLHRINRTLPMFLNLFALAFLVAVVGLLAVDLA